MQILLVFLMLTTLSAFRLVPRAKLNPARHLTRLRWGEKDDLSTSTSGDRGRPDAGEEDFSFSKPLKPNNVAPKKQRQRSNNDGDGRRFRRNDDRSDFSQPRGGVDRRGGYDDRRGGGDRRGGYDNRRGGGDRRGSGHSYGGRSDDDRSYNRGPPRSFDRSSSDRRPSSPATPPEAKINMRELESLGYSHLYGISPILNALSEGRRDFSPDDVLSEPEDPSIPEKTIPTTRLFVQESSVSSSPSSRSASKAAASESIKVRSDEGGELERSDSSISPTNITNYLPFVTSLLTAACSSPSLIAELSGLPLYTHVHHRQGHPQQHVEQ